MSRDDITDEVERYYSAAFQRHGATPRGVDWNSEESQSVRFAQLLRAAPSDRAFTINDYGCGYGALVPFLRQGGHRFAYRGFDLSEPMLAHAREAHAAPNCSWVGTVEDLDVADVTVSSGIFNVRLAVSHDDWLQYVIETIARMAAISRTALAFNMLTSYSDADRMRPDLFYGDPGFFFDHCKRTIAPAVALLHDYGLWEFTIIVRKEL